MALFLSQELFSTQWNFFPLKGTLVLVCYGTFFFITIFFFFYLLDIVSCSSVWSLTVSLRMTLNFRSPPPCLDWEYRFMSPPSLRGSGDQT